MNRHFLRYLHSISQSVGIDVRLLANPLRIPGFLRDMALWRRLGGSIDALYPCLGDKTSQAGAISGHYFQLDLLVANQIFRVNPRRHIDVGSRLDGFVAHVAAFREIDVLDIRPLKLDAPNIRFRQVDLMALDEDLSEATPSLSCLHALEHFGLGRYGDPLNPKGHLIGFENLLRILAPQGLLYLAVPVATQGRIEFNAHRIFNLGDPLLWAGDRLALEQFWLIDDLGQVHSGLLPQDFREQLDYGCGIYVFRKQRPITHSAPL